MRWGIFLLFIAPLCCTCAITGTDGGDPGEQRDAEGFNFSPHSAAKKLCVSDGLVCAITHEGALNCWGVEIPENLRAIRSFEAVSCGRLHVCALRTFDPDHNDAVESEACRVECFGRGDKFQQVSGASVANRGLLSICSGAYYSCGIATSGENIHSALQATRGKLTCWGESGLVEEMREATESSLFDSVACGEFGACAVEAATRRVRCWGEEEIMNPPADAMASVSVGINHACGIVAPPEERVAGASPGFSGPGGRLVCWGSGESSVEQEWLTAGAAVHTGKNRAPIGAAVAVSAGGEHTCAIMADGRAGGALSCWGSWGRGGVPTGTFVAVAAAGMRTCAASSRGGTVVCWGQTEGCCPGPVPCDVHNSTREPRRARRLPLPPRPRAHPCPPGLGVQGAAQRGEQRWGRAVAGRRGRCARRQRCLAPRPDALGASARRWRLAARVSRPGASRRARGAARSARSNSSNAARGQHPAAGKK
jgi:hypothetical protein